MIEKQSAWGCVANLFYIRAMFGLQRTKRTLWPSLALGIALAAFGVGQLAPLPSKVLVGLGCVVVALIIVIVGALSHRRPNVREILILKEEGTKLLNCDPMSLLKRGAPRDSKEALLLFEIHHSLWVEEVLPVLRR